MWFPGMLVGMHSSLSSDKNGPMEEFFGLSNARSHPSVASSWCKLHCGSAPSLHPPMKLPLTQTFGTLLELVFSVNSLLKNVGKIQIRARGKGVERIDEIHKLRHQLSKINYNHWPQRATTNSKGKGYLENHSHCKQVVGNHANCNSFTSKLALTTNSYNIFAGSQKNTHFTPQQLARRNQRHQLGSESPVQKKTWEKHLQLFGDTGSMVPYGSNMAPWYTQSFSVI